MSLFANTCILALHAGQQIGVYLSDISGAFDRVSSDLLLEKLKAAGVSPEMLNFIDAYLKPRRSRVIVGGAQSREFILQDTVFQGTVLGPKFWNAFFDDVSAAIPPEFQSNKFADDLTCLKLYAKDTSTEGIHKNLEECQKAVHGWGRKNQVLFDSSKEEFAVIHETEGDGEDFRYLGTWMDTSLRMARNIEKILSRTRPKVKALLRSHRFYTTTDMVQQFKTHILCHLECNSGGFYHALDTVLAPLDNLQTQFVKSLGLTIEQAFLEYNLAPLRLRRDIAMLGLLSKCVHGTAHEDLRKLFPLMTGTKHSYQTRHQLHRHELQLEEDRPGTHHALLRRSIFGLTRVWNRLPAEVVTTKSVPAMQKTITAMARGACAQGQIQWDQVYSPRTQLLQDTSYFQMLLTYAF